MCVATVTGWSSTLVTAPGPRPNPPIPEPKFRTDTLKIIREIRSEDNKHFCFSCHRMDGTDECLFDSPLINFTVHLGFRLLKPR